MRQSVGVRACGAWLGVQHLVNARRPFRRFQELPLLPPLLLPLLLQVLTLAQGHSPGGGLAECRSGVLALRPCRGLACVFRGPSKTELFREREILTAFPINQKKSATEPRRYMCACPRGALLAVWPSRAVSTQLGHG